MNHFLSGTIESIKSACQITVAKCVGVLTIVILNVTFGKVDAAVVTGIGMLIVIDFITALIREKKLKRKIESRKAIKTAIKLAFYGLLVSAGYITESVISMNVINLPIAEIVNGFLAITELISILENAEQMGIPVPTNLLSALKATFKKNKK